jgi:hypothetical protein
MATTDPVMELLSGGHKQTTMGATTASAAAGTSSAAVSETSPDTIHSKGTPMASTAHTSPTSHNEEVYFKRTLTNVMNSPERIPVVQRRTSLVPGGAAKAGTALAATKRPDSPFVGAASVGGLLVNNTDLSRTSSTSDASSAKSNSVMDETRSLNRSPASVKSRPRLDDISASNDALGNRE